MGKTELTASNSQENPKVKKIKVKIEEVQVSWLKHMNDNHIGASKGAPVTTCHLCMSYKTLIESRNRDLLDIMNVSTS